MFSVLPVGGRACADALHEARTSASKEEGWDVHERVWAWVASTCATEWQMDTHVCFLLEVDSGALLGTPGLVLLRGGFAVAQRVGVFAIIFHKKSAIFDPF